MLNKVTITAALLLTLGAMPVLEVIAGGDEHNSRRTRMMVPDYVECDRNQLTSYFGQPIEYSRDKGYFQVTINTDYETVESLALNFINDEALRKHMFLNGKPFSSEDWHAIESANGEIKKGVRAIAWVCSQNEYAPIVNWETTSDSN